MTPLPVWPDSGEVVYVRSLADSGPRTLRGALALAEPKTIKFLVSGNIALLSDLMITQNGHTIDGSTAPCGGVCIRGKSIVIDAVNVTLRHLRLRPGVEAGASADALSITENGDNILIENCSLSWCKDELIGSYGKNIEIRYCLLYESLKNPVEAYGPIFSGLVSDNVDMHHNLIAMTSYRNPKIDNGAGHYMRFANNIVYNCSRFVTIDTPIVGQTVHEQYIDIVENRFITGSTWLNGTEMDTFDLQLQAHVYLEGNIGPYRSDDLTPGYMAFPESDRANIDFLTEPVQPLPAYLTSWEIAYPDILANAGATMPKRDTSDLRILALVEAGSGVLVSDPADVGGYPDLTI